MQQYVDELPIGLRRLEHTEPGVVVLRVDILMTPQAARRKINGMEGAVSGGDFQTQLEVHTDHHGQLADQHQPISRDIAQIADGSIGEPVKYLQKTR